VLTYKYNKKYFIFTPVATCQSLTKRAAQFMPFAALSGMMEMFEATRIETEKKLEK